MEGSSLQPRSSLPYGIAQIDHVWSAGASPWNPLPSAMRDVAGHRPPGHVRGLKAVILGDVHRSTLKTRTDLTTWKGRKSRPKARSNASQS